MQKETENKSPETSKELNFSQNWVGWVRSCPANQIKEVKEAIKKIISEVNAEPVSEETFHNYFYKKTELPARFRGPIVDFAREFDFNPSLTLDFTFIKEKAEA